MENNDAYVLQQVITRIARLTGAMRAAGLEVTVKAEVAVNFTVLVDDEPKAAKGRRPAKLQGSAWLLVDHHLPAIIRFGRRGRHCPTTSQRRRKAADGKGGRMPLGPGKYDTIASDVRRKTHAESVPDFTGNPRRIARHSARNGAADRESTDYEDALRSSWAPGKPRLAKLPAKPVPPRKKVPARKIAKKRAGDPARISNDGQK